MRSYRRANVDSDNFLVIAKLEPSKNMASNIRRQQRHLISYDMAKLKDVAMKKKYHDRIQPWCQNYEMMTELANGNWTTFKTIITESAEGMLKGEINKI
jgi:hypothetical protein